MAEFWFNTRTKQVEETDNKSQSRDLLGPYPSHEAAAGALESAARRTEEWDDEDRKWREGE